MNIAERFAAKQNTIKKNEETTRIELVQELANNITESLSIKKNIEAIEYYLSEHGSVSIQDFGCLCQGGACTWQKGLDELLRPIASEWESKGVNFTLSLSLNLRVNTNVRIYGERKMTIEEIVDWNENDNKRQ